MWRNYANSKHPGKIMFAHLTYVLVSVYNVSCDYSRGKGWYTTLLGSESGRGIRKSNFVIFRRLLSVAEANGGKSWWRLILSSSLVYCKRDRISCPAAKRVTLWGWWDSIGINLKSKQGLCHLLIPMNQYGLEHTQLEKNNSKIHLS